METFATLENCFQPLIIVAELSILDICEGPKNASCYGSVKFLKLSENTYDAVLFVKGIAKQIMSHKYMIALTQTTNTETFAFRLQTEKTIGTCSANQCAGFYMVGTTVTKEFKSRVLFKKIAHFTGKVLQNHKLLECKIFRIILKHVSDHVSVLFQFTWLHLWKL